MTDIQGSSLLYEQDELAARLTVARHNELLTAGIEGRDGAVIRPRAEGDSIFAVFARLAERLLRACPRLRILVTSREPLGIAGEIAFRVPSLALPELPSPSAGRGGITGRLPGAAVLCEYESVRLFVDRAQAVQPGFPVTDQSAQAIAKICRRLDGIPLALELAAARVKVLTIDQIATRVDRGSGKLR